MEEPPVEMHPGGFVAHQVEADAQLALHMLWEK
jgi:hypothetical protein